MLIHSFFLSDFQADKDSYPQMYRIVNSYLENGYSVIYAVEPFPQYKIIRNMQSGGVNDVENMIEEGTLHIVDREKVYSHMRKKGAGGKEYNNSRQHHNHSLT